MALRRTTAAAVILASLVIVAYSTRAHIARSHPSLPAYYSFKGHPFTYEHTYRSGRVGPFRIGQSKSDAIEAISSQRTSFRLPMEMSPQQRQHFYFTENNSVPPDMRAFLDEAEEWRITLGTVDGVGVAYTVTFADGRVAEVKSFSSLLAGL